MGLFALLGIAADIAAPSRSGVWVTFSSCCVLLVTFICIRSWLRLIASGLPLRRSSPSDEDRPPKAELGLQVLHDPGNADIDIVAVHGLGANPDFAWVWLPKNNPRESSGYPDKPFNWLEKLLPSKLSCRVLAFNYDSAWFFDAPQQRLSNISDGLLDNLRDNRETATSRPRPRPLIFIGHSFGGNIIEQAIVSASRQPSEHLQIAESTVGVIFLGTPHRGCHAAKWAEIIASLASHGFVTEPRLLRALEAQSDSLTDRLHDFSRWLISESVPVVCAFEQLVTDYSSRVPLAGKELVVPEASACIDGHHKISLHTDHLKINKFYGSDDLSFKLIYPHILRMAESANEMISHRQNPKPIPTDERCTSGDLRQCLQSMRVANPLDDLSKVHAQKGERVGHTCEWILKREEFCAWAASKNPQLLRLVGSPGIGKTIMSTFLVEVLQGKIKKAPGKLFAYFFCDDKNQDQKTPTSILRSLMWQILLQKNELFQHILPDLEKHTNDRVFEHLFDDFFALWRIFQAMLRDECAGEVFILIDALDECEKATRQRLLHSIVKLFPPSPELGSRQVKVLVTCRPYINDIEEELQGVGVCMQMDSADINKDLTEYIDAKVNELAAKKKYTSLLKEKVGNTLKREVGGTFLWVSLMVAELQRPELLMMQVEAKLQSLPHGLDDTYTAILDRILPDNQETAQFILRCMVAARRPLKKTEILTAFVTLKNSSIQSREDLEAYDDILSACSSILVVSGVEFGDDVTVNFCHQSVKDFLLQSATFNVNTWYFTSQDETNLLMFKACWEYLIAEFSHATSVIHTEEATLGDAGEHSSQHLFLQYSSEEWVKHAIASFPAVLVNLHECAIDVARAPTLRDVWLRWTAQEGQAATVELLLKKGADINIKNGYDETPLLLAAQNGHETTVKLLLENGAEINIKDQYDQTPLLLAIRKGHETIVKLLLENGAEVNPNNLFGVPLSQAAEYGHETIVKLLLENGAEVNPNNIFGLPLLQAAKEKHETIVKLLLEAGVEVNRNDIFEGPLLLAAKNGHETTVKLILENGAKVDPGNLFTTPLSLAATNGHETIIKLLLGHGADIDCKDGYDQTPLSLATENGHETIVRLLLDQGADIDCKDKNHRTPLSIAAGNGHETIVKLLLDQGAAGIESRGIYERRVVGLQKQAR